MHPSLDVADILVLICEQLGSGSSREKTLASLARTCTTFKGPALDEIWSEDVDIATIFSVLPRKPMVYFHFERRRALTEDGSPPVYTEVCTAFLCVRLAPRATPSMIFTTTGSSESIASGTLQAMFCILRIHSIWMRLSSRLGSEMT